MLRMARHTRGRRLLARALTIIFALVTIWGSAVHACEQPHRKNTHEIAAEHDGDRGAASHAPDGNLPTSEREHDEHPCCADLQCHVGSAIVTTGNVRVPVLPMAERFIIADQAGESWFLSSLDRPPRRFLQN